MTPRSARPRGWFSFSCLLCLLLAGCGGFTPPPSPIKDHIPTPVEWQGITPPADISGEPPAAVDPTKMTHSQFIDFVGNMACQSQKETGVPASVTVAQAILESGWGSASIGDANNLFGVKGSGDAGSIKATTKECNEDGSCYQTEANFAKYSSFQASLTAHARLISSSSNYKKAMEHKDDPDEFARQLQGVYATDPKYAEKLINIMKQNDLYQYKSCNGTDF